jgi:predicted aldo/keto reductase-like oxidoreductase
MMAYSNQIPKRPLGTTGEEVSILGLGGSHIGYGNQTDEEITRLVRSAIDGGITFMDNNWGYHNGRSEERMGRALEDGYRDKVFLMTKFDARDKAGALAQLDESLKRLKTDHIDLWQAHEVIYYNDPDILSAPGGALEALDEAKRAGKVRFAGFTGHKSPDILNRMLELYKFDTAQMPLNVMDAHFQSFAENVVPRCLELGVGIIGMKSFGDPHILKSGIVTPEEALGYALSLPVSTVVAGIDRMEVLEQDLKIARGFQPLSQERIDDILSKTAPINISGDGRYELYKTSKQYDADPGRKTHGFPSIKDLPF